MARLAPVSSRPRKPAKILGLFLAGLCLGVAGYLIGERVAASGAFDDLPVRWADLLAAFVGLIMVVAAGATALISLSPAALARTLNLEGRAGPDEIRDTRLQAVILALSGVIVILPPLLALADVGAAPALALLAVLLVVHTVLNLALYRRVDELFRRAVIEAGALTFWLGQGVLFLWAVAERLGVAPALTGWDIYVVLLTAYLIASVGVAARRGLA